MGVCLNARGALAAAQTPQEGTEQALGERKRSLHSSGTTIPEFITQVIHIPNRGVTPHEGLGKSSDNLPCPGEQELNCNTQETWQSTADRALVLHLWKVFLMNPPGTPRGRPPFPGRECGKYLHRVAWSLSRGERKPKPTGISALHCIC